VDSVLLTSIADRYKQELACDRTDKFLELVSQETERYFDDYSFPTMFACSIDLETKTMTYSDANSEAPLLFRDNQIKPLTKEYGYHLGVDHHYSKEVILLKQYDILCFMSDAVREADANRSSHQFHSEMENLLIPLQKENLTDILEKMLEYISKIHPSGLPLEDDMTIILLQHRPGFHQHLSCQNSPKNIDHCIQYLTKLLTAYNYPIQQRMDIIVSVEEMLLNAYHHGNKKDPAKKIHVSLDISYQEVTFLIEDEGEGFDYQAPKEIISGEQLLELMSETGLDSEEDDAFYLHGRGIVMTKSYMDRVEYLDKGNKVLLTKQREPSRTRFHLTDSSGLPKETLEAQDKNNPNQLILEWQKDLDVRQHLDSSILTYLIDFKNVYAMTSKEISSLLMLTKYCINHHRTIQFKVYSDNLRNMLFIIGFSKLGVKFI